MATSLTTILSAAVGIMHSLCISSMFLPAHTLPH